MRRNYTIFILAMLALNAEGQGLPKMEVLGNNVLISNGSAIPTTANNTDFGNISVNGGASTRRFVIRNVGTAPLRFRCGDPLGSEPEECEEEIIFDFFGGNFLDFKTSFVPIQPGSWSLPANSSVTFVLRFSSTAVGMRRTTAGIFSNDPINGRFFFVVQGNGIDAPLGPQPRAQTLGNGVVIENSIAPCCPRLLDHTDFGSGISNGVRTFTIRNLGDANLTLSNAQVLIPSGSGTFSVVTQPASTLPPNASTQFTVSYNGGFGRSLATIVIDNNSPAEDPIAFRIGANL